MGTSFYTLLRLSIGHSRANKGAYTQLLAAHLTHAIRASPLYRERTLNLRCPFVVLASHRVVLYHGRDCAKI